MVVPFAKVLFFSETLVVLYVKNNKILIFLIEYERDKDMFNVRLRRTKREERKGGEIKKVE